MTFQVLPPLLPEMVCPPEPHRFILDLWGLQLLIKLLSAPFLSTILVLFRPHLFTQEIFTEHPVCSKKVFQCSVGNGNKEMPSLNECVEMVGPCSFYRNPKGKSILHFRSSLGGFIDGVFSFSVRVRRTNYLKKEILEELDH